jgi:DNA integrity scanning protein DisA with diadenylate cyclase activity
MNYIARWLFAVGWLSIVSGVILGFIKGRIETLNIIDEIETTLSFPILFMYAIVGLISGLMMFGFAEIVNLLDKGNQTKNRIENHLKYESKMKKSSESEIDKAVKERKEQRLSNTKYGNGLKADVRAAQEIADQRKNSNELK